MFHYFKRQPLIGLDFGAEELRLLQLQETAKGFRVAKLLHRPLTLKETAEEQRTKWQQVQRHLRELVAEEALSGSSVALALPSQVVIRKQVELPSYYKEAELSTALENRLLEYFPGIPERELHFDYVVQGSQNELHQLLLVATRKVDLEHYVQLARGAGLKVAIVDCDLYALARAASYYFYQKARIQEAAVALLDLQWPVCTFVVFHHKDILFQHSWPLDKSYSLAPLNHPSIFVEQAAHCCQLYAATHPKRKLTCMGISGAVDDLESLSGLLEERVSIPVLLVNPFEGMSASPFLKAETLKAVSSRFLLCFGLALRDRVKW